MSTVSGLIEHAETAPDKPALIVDGIEISYRSLLARSAAIARLLRVSEVGVGDRVLYWTRNKRDFAAAFLGITGSGRVAVPVPDGAAPGSVRDLGTVSEATVIIVDDDVRPPSGVAALRFSERGDGSAFEAVPYEQVRGEFDGSDPADDAGALLLFTSGTTSKKKGVLLTHGNLTSATSHINEVMGIEPTIREYVAIPLHHSFGLGRLRCVLQVGGTLVADNGPFDPAKLLHSMGRLRINALSSVPAGFALFMGPMESLLARFGGAIQVVEIGSAAMPAEHKEKLLHLLPNAKLFMHYGLTEASRTTFIELRRDREHWDTVGKPAPGVVVTIVDEHGGEVGPHHEGEIVVRGGHVVNGYFRDPERTRHAFCTHGFRTGDFGFLDDGGFLHLRGRKDELINCGGVKISPLELEAKLRKVMADVDFAVVGVRDPAGVAGKIPVVAYVSTGEPLTLERLIERCSGVVDRYELPRAVLAVDEIPRTENGKVMRRALEQSIDPRLESEQVEARSTLDRELMTIWQRGLGVSDVGVDDSFFGLGGNSLHAARLVNELRERLGEDVYINALFEAPTIAQLAKYLEKHHPRAVRGLMAQATPGDKNTYGAVAATEGRIELPTGCAAVKVSLAQGRLWFIEQLRPGSSAYHLPEALLIDGELDVAALRRSFTELVRRHESLRTTFGVVDDQVVQIVASTVDVEFGYEQLEGAGDREIDAQRLLHDELERPFDLERGPLFRVRLLQTGDRQHLLVYNMHHIISDGWSRELLWRELGALYEAFAAGRPSPLTELPIQYSNFAAWQRQRLRGEVLETQLTYWRKQLAGLETLELLTDLARPAVPSFTGAVESLVLPERTIREIRSLCTEQQVTLFMLLLSAFKALLHRYTGQDDIVVGSPVAGRIRKEVEELIGFFVNMLVLRTDLSGDPSGRELISRVRDAVLGAMRHQEMPFEKLVEELEPERDQSRNPLFQVTLQHFGRQQETLSLSGASVRRPDVDLPTTRFDLEARILEGPTGIRLAVTYSTDLYDSATIKRMLTHFQALIEGIVADPDAPVSRLPLLSAPERRQLVEKWIGAATDYPRDASIHELFAEQVAANPDATALVFGDQQVTYAELDRRANQLAHHLRSLGVEHETLVGLCVERSVEMVVGILGILKAGGAYVPLDPSYPVSRLSLMLEDTQASLLLTQQALANSLPEFDGKTVFLDTDWPTIADRPASAPTSEAMADSLAYIIYTSGSTGRPKGVCVEHRSVVRLVRNTNYVELGPDEVFLQFAPISFDASTFELWGSLLNGARLVIFPPQVPSLEELGRVIEENGITTLWLTAALFKQMVDSHPESLAGVRQLLAGGEELSAPHVERFLATLADRRLVNGYGPTENTTFTCCHVMTRDSVIGRSVPIGRPISNTQVYVLDKNMEPVPVGIPGRLYAGGDGLARCYLNDAELTASKFVPHPFSSDPQARLYDIGDQVRWLADGTLEFLGRVDQQVKIRGFRIELGEIETALLQQPLVREAAVLCHGDAAGEKRLVAYVVPGESAKPGDEDLTVTLRASLAATLPGYMVPAGFALLEALPLTANGKLDRTALSAVECVEEGSKEAFVAPGTPTEQRVAQIWADLFEQRELSIHDDFFRLGGHSLMAMRVISRLHTDFDVELPVQSLFSAPTIAGMAKAVDVLRWAMTDSGDGNVDPDHEEFEI